MGTGYACPVCSTPQRDAEHLANHLAFTAMLRHEAHEEWLAERVPGWSELGPDELGERVVEFAVETEYEEVFEDTVQRAGPGRGDLLDEHARDHGHGGPAGSSPGAAGTTDAETRAILEEAREMTREMLAGDADAESGDEESGANSEPS
jgi:hypothetical protein